VLINVHLATVCFSRGYSYGYAVLREVRHVCVEDGRGARACFACCAELVLASKRTTERWEARAEALADAFAVAVELAMRSEFEQDAAAGLAASTLQLADLVPVLEQSCGLQGLVRARGSELVLVVAEQESASVLTRLLRFCEQGA